VGKKKFEKMSRKKPNGSSRYFILKVGGRSNYKKDPVTTTVGFKKRGRG